DLRRRLLAPDTEAPLAVEHLAGLEVLLCGGDDIGPEACGCAGRLVAQRRACDRDAELEPYHMDRPVERGIAAGLIRQHGIFLEALARVFGLALEHDVGAEREMVRHVAAVAIDGRGDFGHAFLLEYTAGGLRLADFGELEACRGRKAQAVRLRFKA